MKHNTPRIVRTVAAVVCLLLFIPLFADWGNGEASTDALRSMAAVAARLQFLPAVMAVSIVTIVLLLLLTLCFGRIYCSTLCPLGVVQDGVSRAASMRSKSAALRFGYRPPVRWLRYGVLALTAIFIVAGIGVGVSFIDPYSIFGRIVYDGLRPLVQACNNALAAVAGDRFGRETITVSWLSAATAAVMLLIIGILAWRKGRTYCNSFCPVGTLLGEVSRVSVYKIRIDTDKCNGCGICGRKCKSSCIDNVNHTVDASRCVVCFDCVDNCAQGAISYSASKAHGGSNASAKRVAPQTASKTEKSNTPSVEQRREASRAKFLATVAAMAVAVPVAEARRRQGAASAAVGDQSNESGEKSRGIMSPVIPAGADERDRFHSLCTACHLCVSKCPTHVLQPAVTEYGLRGVMQPVMRYDKGYCLYDCTLCGEVCPTGAIRPLDIEQKRSTFIGHAVFNKELCVVNTDAVECGNCARHCPAEAIKMVYSPIDRRSYPAIEKALCIGCGRCEYLCPAKPVSAIRVKGYQRHK